MRMVLGGGRSDGAHATLDHGVRATATATASGPRALTFLFSILAALVAAFAFSGPATAAVDEGAAAPTISSDKADYAPGELVTLRGSNWSAGETIHIDVNDDQTETWRRTVEVVADADGTIIDSFNLPNWFVAVYTVRASGASGVATTSFTDARTITEAALGGGSQVTVAPGASITANVSTTTDGQGANARWRSTSWAIATVEPAGTSAWTCVDHANHDGAGSYSEPLTITAPSTPGTYNAYFKAHADDGCSTAGAGPSALKTIANAVVVQVLKANQTISFAQPSSPAAFGSTFAVTPTANSGLDVSVTAAGACSISGGTVTMTSGSGTCMLTASQAGNAQFNAAQNVVRTVDATKASATLALSGLSHSYEGLSKAAVVTTTPAGLPGVTVTYDGSDGAPTDAGSYAVVASLDNPNYAAADATGTLAISKRPLTVTAAAAAKVFGADDPVLGYSVTSGSLAGSDGFTGALARDAGEDVGEYEITQGSLSAGGNYDLAFVGAKLTITKKQLTGSFTAADKTYDGTAAATIETRSVAGVIGDDDVSLDGGSASFADAGAGLRTVTASGFELAGADKDNYSLAPGPWEATASILPKELVGSFTAEDKVYDRTADATIATRSVAGIVGDDDVTLAGGSAMFADRNAGADKIVTATGFLLAGADKENYSLAAGPWAEQASILRKELVGSFTADDKTYDGNAAASIASRSLAGQVSGDDVSLAGGSAAFANRNAGADKIVTATGFVLAGADKENYSLAAGPWEATASILRKELTGSFTAHDKVYDGTASATVASKLLPGVVSSDEVVLNVSSALFADRTAGLGKTVTADVALSGADAGNYELSSSTAATTADITPKPLTGSFTTAAKVYDGTDAAAAADRALDGVVDVDDVGLTGGSATFADRNVGADKTVTLSGATLAGADKDNYSLLSVETEKADITPKPVAGSFTAASKVYDGGTTATIASRALSGAILGDAVELSGGTATFADEKVGTGKDVTAVGLALSGADAGNYALAAGPWTATADITPKQVTGSFTAADKFVDGTTAATILTRSLAGTVAGDAVALAGGTATFEDATVGQAKSVTGTGFTLAGPDAGNYTLASSTLTTTASITYRWAGFLQPINDTAHQTGLNQSKFKLGQTIPAKFVLRDASGAIVQQAGAPTFTRTGNRGACDATAAPETLPDVLAPDADAAYKWDGGQYHYNWSTKGLTSGEYRIYANLADGTKRYVDICLMK